MLEVDQRRHSVVQHVEEDMLVTDAMGKCECFVSTSNRLCRGSTWLLCSSEAREQSRMNRILAGAPPLQCLAQRSDKPLIDVSEPEHRATSERRAGAQL